MFCDNHFTKCLRSLGSSKQLEPKHKGVPDLIIRDREQNSVSLAGFLRPFTLFYTDFNEFPEEKQVYIINNAEREIINFSFCILNHDMRF